MRRGGPAAAGLAALLSDPRFRNRNGDDCLASVSGTSSREAQGRFEEKLDQAMREQGLPSLGRTGQLVDELYDRMSRVAHNRRSTCVSSFSEPLREFAYGRHPSPI